MLQASLPMSHTCASGLFQSICHVSRCMRLFTLSQRAFHQALSAFAAVIWTPELFPSHWQRKGQQLILKGEEGTGNSSLQTSLPFLLSAFAQLGCLFCGCQLLPLCGRGFNPESLSFSPLLSPNVAFYSLYS